MEINIDWVQAAGIIVALVLGVWNLVQNSKNTKQTRFINTVTAQRIKWLEQLRQDISTFCGHTYTWSASQLEGTQQEHEVVKEIDRLRHLIKLRLNPKGKHDQVIEQLMDEVIKTTDPSQSGKLKELLAKLTSETQLMLKAEWEKVKAESLEGKLRQGSDS